MRIVGQRLGAAGGDDVPGLDQIGVIGELEGEAGVLLDQQHADALFVIDDLVISSYQTRILDLAARNRLPVISQFREFVEAGGLMSYGPNNDEMFRRAAYYVDRILRGTSPADLPVEQPMTFDFVVNMKTAQALGLTFPNEIMLQVTDVLR